MKVKKSSKKQTIPPPDVAALIRRISEASAEDIAEVLEEFQAWRYPRGDLLAWVSVLDRFDQLLADILKGYDLTKLQTNDFTPKTKKLLLHVLRVQRLLLENCTNRKLYNSYDRLSALLLTNDLDVLQASIFVLLRPAQQYAVSTPLDAPYKQAILHRLSVLSRGWEDLVNSGLDLSTLASNETVTIPDQAKQVQIKFYPTTKSPEPLNEKSSTTMLNSGAMETPTRQRPNTHGKSGTPAVRPNHASPLQTGPTVLDLGDATTLQGNFTDRLAALADEHHVPLDDQYMALNRLRLVLMVQDRTTRRKLLSIRLLALATYVYISSEDAAQSNLFIYEPELVPQLADLLRVTKDVGDQVTMGSLLALGACAHHTAKMVEVLTSVSANVNHGILITFFRHMNERLVRGDTVPYDLIDSAMALIAFAATSPSHSNMLMGAGILRLLLEMLDTTGDWREICIPRAAGLIDSIIFSNPQGLSNFSSVDGVNTLVQHVKTEIEMRLLADDKAASEIVSEETLINYANNPLRSVLRSVQRLMQASGGTEGLRNLVDSDLPQSLKAIFLSAPKFGFRVYALAINTMATFVHNEPTSLSILQEMHLPQMLYQQLEQEIPPSGDVLSAVSNAIGAVCLNQVGLDFTVAHPTVISNLVDTVLFPSHEKLFSERESSRQVGLSLDELARHHPSLRPAIITAVVRLLQRANEMGAEFEPPMEERLDYAVDVMANELVASLETQSAKPPPSNPCLMYFTRVFKVLGGLLRNPTVISAFIEAGGIDQLLAMTTSPCWPIRFGSTDAAASLAHLMKHAIEHFHPHFINKMVGSLRETMNQCGDLWREDECLEKWALIRDGKADDRLRQNLKDFHGIAVRLTLLGDALFALSSSNARIATSAIRAFQISEDPSFILDLGKIHRICFRYHVTSKPKKSNPQGDAETKAEDVKEPGVRYLATRLHAILTKFFKCLCRLLHAKRSRDQTHQEHAKVLSDCVAGVLAAHLKGKSISRGTTSKLTVAVTTPGPSVDAFALGTVMAILLDGRGLEGHLNTSLFLAFYRIGGHESCMLLASRITSCMGEAHSIEPESRTDEQKRAYDEAVTAIKGVLFMLSTFATPKALLDSPETHALTMPANGQTKAPLNPAALFLKLRLSIFPLARLIWQSPWILECPPQMLKIAVNSYSVLIAGKDEEPSRPVGGLVLHHSLHQAARPAVVANPLYVDQLADMGFSRRGAEQALVRARNSVATATDLLLTRPNEFQGLDAEDVQSGEPEVETEEQAPTESTNGNLPSVDADNMLVDETPGAVQDDESDLKKQLQELRAEYRQDMAQRSLEIVDKAEDLVAELLPCFPSGEDGISYTINQALEASQAQPSQDAKIAARLRLVSVMLRANDTIILGEDLLSKADAIFTSLPLALAKKARWLSALMLFGETVFGFFGAVCKIKLGDDPKPSATSTSSVLDPARHCLFALCADILRSEDISRDNFVSCLRLLIVLSRAPTAQLPESILIDCFKPFKKMSDGFAGCHPLLVMMVRHVLDTECYLEEIMRGEIRDCLSPGRGKVLDIQYFVRQLRQVALREPTCFIRAIEKECALVDPTPPQSVYHIRSKDERKDGSTTIGGDGSISSSNTSQCCETIVQNLLRELSRALSMVLQTPVEDSSIASQEISEADSYSALVMSVLTELLGSYISVKKAFLENIKQNAYPGMMKPKGGISAFISDLVCAVLLRPDATSPPDSGNDTVSSKRLAISSRATTMVVALCSDVISVADKKGVPEDMISIRKLVLDAVAKAIRDSAFVIDINLRYGRLWALGELIYRLLMERPSSSPRQVNNSGLHMAKTMLEKNFVGLLTTALGEVDLNYPDVRNVLVNLLRALEHLSKLSVKWGKNKGPQEKSNLQSVTEEDDVSSARSDTESESDVDMLEEDQVATDLYRNSALGMLGGEFADDEDDEIDDEDEDDDMDIGEDLTDDEDGTATQTSDDDSMTSVMEHEDWVDDLGHDQEGSEDEDGLEPEVVLGSAEEDGDMWEDEHDDQESYGTEEEDDSMDDGAMAGDGLFETGIDDPIMDEFEEVDDGYEEIGLMEPFHEAAAPGISGPWGWSHTSGFGHLGMSDGVGALNSAGGDLLATTFNNSSGRAIAQHPLLAGSSAQSVRHLGSNITEFLSVLENMGGSDAVQLLESLISSRSLHGADATRVAFSQDQNGSISVSVDGRVFSLDPRHHHHSNSSINRSAGFLPATTLQRWQEELSLLPTAQNEVTSRLVVHIVNQLLPLARQRAKMEKEDVSNSDELDDSVAAEAGVKDSAESIGVQDEDGDEDDVEDDDEDDDEDVDMADGPQSAASLSGEEENEDSDPAVGPRTVVSIHGREVDITDAGIDLEFLEALPDDMRADVIEQHLRERRTDQRTPTTNMPEATSQINAEFLNALPPDIRAEVIMQEAMENARRSQPLPVARPSGSGGGIPVASVERTDRNSRQGQDNNSIDGPVDPGVQSNLPSSSITGKYPQREAIQLLEKPGIAILVRLLFFPHAFKKSYLFKVLVNLCENTTTRNDLLDLLISVVHDGSGDLPAVDRSFQQMSLRGASAGSTPKATPRGKVIDSPASMVPSGFFGHLQSDHIPTFIAQRSFEALSFIVSSNANAASYFLTEHEQTGGLRKHAFKKGKGKEKMSPQSKFPIVVLLGLLDRPLLARTPGLMETVTALVLTITRPLALPKSTEAQDGLEINDHKSPTGVVDAAESSEVTSKVIAKAIVSPSKHKALVIPPTVLRLVVNCLTAGDCTSRTFSQTLAAMQNLTSLPEAKNIILQELCARCQDLGTVVHEQLCELVPALSVDTEDLGSLTLAKFSPPSSAQAQLLRLLKTIDYLHLNKVDPDPPAEKMRDEEQAVAHILDSFSFEALWNQLGQCLSMVEARGTTEQIATVLLPLVEALMVVSKYRSPVQREARSPSVTPPTSDSPDFFVSFTTTHRKVLNTIVRNNPSLLSGSFSLLIRNPRVLDFDNKRTWFFQKLKRKKLPGIHSGTLQLTIRRQYVFEDSFLALQRWNGEELKYGKLSVKFRHEDGVDAGGVTREWYSVLAQQIFDPNFALFEPCAADQQTYQPNKTSWINEVHLSYFKFVGRVIGKAVYDGRLLDAYFNRAFYKQILGRTVDMRDLESIDPEYHKSLQWMLNNDITGVIDQEFTIEDDQFGEKKTVELKKNGATIPVTEENKEDYVKLVVSYRLDHSIREQIKAFLEGFYDIIPHELIQIFEPDQLELLISGITTVDVDELKNATQLSGWKHTDPEIAWFWRALRSFSQEERSRFLMFVTSSSRVPLGGFKQLQGSSGTQPFQIQKLYGKENGLPQASTCFNLLLLPTYPSYEQLRERLQFAITETGGFGKA